jgi:hypothetical protein
MASFIAFAAADFKIPVSLARCVVVNILVYCVMCCVAPLQSFSLGGKTKTGRLLM